MKTFDIWVSKKFTFFRIKTCKMCIQRWRLYDNQLIINRILVRRFVDYVCAQLSSFQAAFNSAFYTGNTHFECNRIVLF